MIQPRFIPLPSNVGIGFTSKEKLDDTQAEGYSYRPLRGFHNYHVTPKNWTWPAAAQQTTAKVIDGFSPNLNKHLHCGHLKNLAVAASLANLLEGKPVAMLGASLGIQPGALDTYKNWCQLAGYDPTIYLDNQLPPPSQKFTPGTGEYEGCMMYKDIVVIKSTGQPTYAYHDLSFAEVIKPNYYLTGNEQKTHFVSLDLGEKHLALGLVLGPDGKKMRSTIKLDGEESNSLSADELFQMVLDHLREAPNPRKLAWNILAYQFNSSAVQSNTKFNAEVWVKPESPGMYISYTYARITNALKRAEYIPEIAPVDIQNEDADLLGVCSYFVYAQKTAKVMLQPNILAKYALDLSTKLANLYHKKQIQGGPVGYIYAINQAKETLGKTMDLLGMHLLEKI